MGKLDEDAGYLQKSMNMEVKAENIQGIPWWFSSRLWLALLACLGFMFMYTQRVVMSVTIVCMVNHTALQQQEHNVWLNTTGYNNTDRDNWTNITGDTSGESECTADITKTSQTLDGPFTWEKELQGHLLGAFFYGYLVSAIPAGLLAERFGGKWVFAGFYFTCTMATLLTPLAARAHYGLLVAARVLVGVGSGATFPVMHSIWGHWAPPMERSKLAGITYAGCMMGNVIAMPLSGILCEHGFDGGWPSVFYISGMVSIIWLLLWVLLVSDNPLLCKRMSAKEKLYISHSLEGQVSNQHHSGVPWLSILRSPSVWAIVVANFTSDWGLYTLLTNIPTYMYEVLKFDIQSNGFYSALPFLGLWINMNISPIIADKLRCKGLLSTTATRKVFNTIGHMGASVSLIGLSFMTCNDAVGAVALLALGVALSGSSYTGFLVNHMDIAPRYAGTLLGLTNSLAATSGFVAPYVAAVLTTNQTRSEWQIVFFLSSGIYAVGAVFYIIFGSGELQPWALDTTIPSPSKVVVTKLENGELHPEKQELLPTADTSASKSPLKITKHSP